MLSKRILFLATYPIEAASTRYRLCQYFPYFEQAGYSCTLYTFFSSKHYDRLHQKGHWPWKLGQIFKGLFRLWRLRSRWKQYDILFISRSFLPLNQYLLLWVLRNVRIPIIYDIDDTVFLKSHRGISGFVERPSAIPKIIRLSRAVIAGNQFLKEFCLKHNPNTVCLPTSVAPAAYRRFVPEEREPGFLVLGWVGSHSTAKYLHSIQGVLQRLATRYVFKLVVIGAGSKVNIPGVTVENIKWQRHEEEQYFSMFDIGLYPLDQNTWTLGKCGFKAIQYMAAGVPCVVSKIGVNSQIIQHGENGFLCENETDWEASLAALMESESLRKRFIQKGFQTMQENFSVQKYLPEYLKILESLAKVPS